MWPKSKMHVSINNVGFGNVNVNTNEMDTNYQIEERDNHVIDNDIDPVDEKQKKTDESMWEIREKVTKKAQQV